MQGSSQGKRAQIWRISVTTNFMLAKRTDRSTGHRTFVMVAFPRTRFQTWGTSGGTGFGALVVGTALAASFLALVVAPFALGVARATAKVLAIQRTLARVFGVVYACYLPRPSLVDVQVSLLTLPTFSLALLGTAAHWLIAQFGASGGGWVLVTSNLFRVFAIRKLLQDLFLAPNGLQIFELMTKSGESLWSCQ